MTSDHRLLILSCSQRKRPDLILLPALERYDGPVFRMLRRFLRTWPSKGSHPEVYILSAQFGLISAHQLIPSYDCRMTPQQASAFQPQVLNGSLVIPGIHNSMIFRANKECPYKSSWIL